MKNYNNPNHFPYGSIEYNAAFSIREKEYAVIDKLNKAAAILFNEINSKKGK